MQRYKFVIRTIQSVEIDAESEDAAKQAIQQQLPLNAEIVSVMDCDADNLRQINPSEIYDLFQSEKLTFEPKSDIINIENEEGDNKIEEK